MNTYTKLSLVIVVSAIALSLCTAYAASIVYSEILHYEVKAYHVALAGNPPPATYESAQVVTLTATVTHGSEPVANAPVTIYDGTDVVATGTTNADGLFSTEYTISEERAYDFKAGYEPASEP